LAAFSASFACSSASFLAFSSASLANFAFAYKNRIVFRNFFIIPSQLI